MNCLSPQAFLEALHSGDFGLEFCLFNLTRVPAAWSLVDRVVDENYLSLIVDESGQGCVASTPLNLAPGHFLWISPGVIHSLRPTPGQRPFSFYHLRFVLRRGRQAVRLDRDWLRLEQAAALQSHFAALLEAYQRASPFAGVKCRALLTVLAAEALALAAAPPPRRCLSGAQRRLIAAWTRDRLGGALAPRDLAAAVGLSPDYFSRLFRQTYGVAPRTWIKQQRLQEAASLLRETSMTVTAVARAVGYGDLFLFSRLFRAAMGCSPRQYRAR